MQEIFDYISTNTFLTTIISVVIGGLLSSFTTIYISNKERKERKKEEFEREKRRQYENKAELKITKVLTESNNKPDIEIFLAPFNVEYSEDKRDYKIVYPRGITNKKNHAYKEFYIKNIGNADINQLDICATFKKHNTLTSYESFNYIVKKNLFDYNFCYDRKILKGEEIIVRVYFSKKYEICHPFSCTLVFLFKDSYKNLWRQPFWYEKDNVYEPHSITYKEYRTAVTIDDAVKCFENPWLW